MAIDYKAALGELHRDYETRSAVDLRKCGAHVYAQHPSTDVIVACYAFGDEEPFDWYPGRPLPARVVAHIEAGGIVTGHNAAFEAAIDREIMGPRYGFPVPTIEQLDCTLARAAVQALPLDLDGACNALGLAEKKDKEGHRLMLRMCKPRIVHPDGRIEWWDDHERIFRLTLYCRQDVIAERALGKALRPLTPEERRVWILDQRMNNGGVAIDGDFITAAARFAATATARLDVRMKQVTGGAVEKATQVERIKDFAKANGVELQIVVKTRRNGEEYEAEAADKEALEDLLAGELLPNVREAFQIRLDAGKSSVKKLTTMAAQRCTDGRARGTVQYHAASTGRWAGRGIQLHNLPRKGIIEPGGWAAARRDLEELNLDTFELVWGPALDVMSRMLRGAVVAKPGHKLIYGDYSQVEARGAVWSAGQRDQVELFATGGKIYEEMGAYIFGLTIEEVIELHETKADTVPRFVGKESVLGCGFGVGPAAFERNCKKKGRVVLAPGIAYKAVHGWREKNWRVVEYWRELEDAAKAAIESPGKVYSAGPYSYRVKGNWLQCRLPSGRVIWYRRPTIEPKTADIEQLDAGETVPRYRWAIHYWGVNGITKKWAKESTWGGKLLENADQAMCRDFIAGSLLRLDDAGYNPILSVHDEAIGEVPDEDRYSVAEFLEIMTAPQPWAAGFPLKAEGGAGLRYAKG